MTGSRIVRWSGSTNSPTASDFYSYLEREDGTSRKAKKAFLCELVRDGSETQYMPRSSKSVDRKG